MRVKSCSNQPWTHEHRSHKQIRMNTKLSPLTSRCPTPTRYPRSQSPPPARDRSAACPRQSAVASAA
ncbi:hypothetical protein FA95DRAFT_1357534 [Auriscalpium vulgare]|uniref:Uncharacterized protein n=1 Tax=Auriscalpium vulgare TaxID=40419 RepID=A0ACB8R1G8_9AGAM|nr:hypothetical protein FA95DRAFT_1357534 [Auriscalpium vulgare]